MADSKPLLLTLFSLIFAFQFNFCFTITTKITSKGQLECTMCTSCQNPCPLAPPPTTPEIACPPPPPPPSPSPPPALPPQYPAPRPPAKPACPPPPKPPMVQPWPKPQPTSASGGGVVAGTCFPTCIEFSPPTAVVPYFPYYNRNRPSSVVPSNSVRLRLEPVVFSISVFLALMCCF